MFCIEIIVLDFFVVNNVVLFNKFLMLVFVNFGICIVILLNLIVGFNFLLCVWIFNIFLWDFWLGICIVICLLKWFGFNNVGFNMFGLFVVVIMMIFKFVLKLFILISSWFNVCFFLLLLLFILVLCWWFIVLILLINII